MENLNSIIRSLNIIMYIYNFEASKFTRNILKLFYNL